MPRLAACLLTLVLAATGAAAADPPSRVGRVAHTVGEVAAWLDAERGWEKAYVNTPLTSENSLWTEPAARAEVRIGSTAIRLNETTQLDVRRLDEEVLRAHVVRGTVALSIHDFERGETYTFTTPQSRYRLLAPGRYRIDADEVGLASRLTVFSGSAELEIAGRRIPLAAGEAVRVQGEGGEFDFERAATSDFDHWSFARDEHLADLRAPRHVSPRMTGYEDLDRHGDWATEPDYGAVWYPARVEPDWAPYRNGHWTWLRPWGWTWIDHAPWGYAPSHYGRWVFVRNRWGWCPGRYVARPVWAPALVGWVGGPGWSVTVGAARAPVVGWYPLAPWDRYQPWYTNSRTYINNVNVIVVNKPHGRGPRDRDHDDDDHRVRGTTVMYRDGFVSRRPVASARPPVSREIVAAQPVASAASVLPPRSEIPQSRPLTAQGAKPAPSAPSAQVGAPAASAPAYREPSSAQPPVRTKPQGQPQAEPQPVPKPWAQPSAEPQARPKPQPQAAPAVQQKPQPQYAPPVQSKPAPVETQPRPKPQAQPPAAPQAQPKPQAQPQAAPQAQPKPQAQPEARAPTGKPVAKPEPEEKPAKPATAPARP